MFNFLKIIVTLVMLNALPGRAAETSRKNNLDVLQECYGRLIRTILPDSQVNGAQPVLIKSQTDGSVNWLIEAQLFQWAKTNGFLSVYRFDAAGPRAAGPHYSLEYRPLGGAVRYEKATDSHVARTIQASLYILFTDPEKRIVASQSSSLSLQDTVLVKDLKTIEDVQYDFTRGDRSRSLFSIVLEPLLLTAVTGLVVYFFYSFRSK